MSRLKKVLIMVLTVIVISSFASIAAEGKLSGWAEEEANEAINAGIVPELLEGHYQTAITRYEYVLLALDILEAKGEQIKVMQQYPFSDIDSHPYEEEIVKAYNAKLINGYPDGTFKADKAISREEIATLVVNLVKRLDADRIISQSEEYVYSDEYRIESWARRNIDYCYANGIIKGTGKDGNNLVVLDPKGQATVEQSIIMMYRLAKDEHILKYHYGSIVIEELINGEKVSVVSNNLNKFAIAFGGDITDKVIDINKSADIKISRLDKGMVQLDYNDGSAFLISKSDGQIRVSLKLTDYDNLTLINQYKDLVDEYYDVEDLDDLLDQTLVGYKENGPMIMTRNMNLTTEFNMYVEIDVIGAGTEQEIYYFVLTIEL